MQDTTAAGTRPRIGTQLVREGLITREQLADALEEQQRRGGKIVAVLIALGHMDQQTFLRFLSKQPGMASIDLAGYSIPDEVRDLVPADFARTHEVVPMDKMGRDLTVGMACPLDLKTIESLGTMTGLRVRALLVAPEAIKTVLERFYGAGDPVTDPPASNEPTFEEVTASLTFDSVMGLVRQVTSLPALPDTVQRIQEAIENPDTGARDVAEILKRDPALAARVISLANAPCHGFAHRVTSIENATALLGLADVYGVVLAATVINGFGTSSVYDYRAFWRRSVVTANLAKILARTAGVQSGSDVFAAGLLHDIGRAVFAEVVPAPYAALPNDVADGDLIKAEHKAFGIAHPEVGYIVAKNWGLPAGIRESIRFHHCPDRAVAAKGTVSLVATAAGLADHLEYPALVPLETCLNQQGGAAESLKLEPEQVTAILDIARALRDAPDL